jgi:TetR/AcrR family transcriptional regulator, transcriptional repressor for nem operon
MIMGRPSFRQQIIESGTKTVHERGFLGTGLREITASAGVAQGSFTNHFFSKEEFGIAVLDHYFSSIREVMDATLLDQSKTPVGRIYAYFDAITDLLDQSGWRFGCLAGNMSLEASETSERLRQRLVEIFAEWTPPFAEAIRQSQASGGEPHGIDPAEAGAALLEAWHGAMLRMKVDRRGLSCRQSLALRRLVARDRTDRIWRTR